MPKKLYEFGKKCLLPILLSAMFCVSVSAEGGHAGTETDNTAEPSGSTALSADSLSGGPAIDPASEADGAIEEPASAEEPMPAQDSGEIMALTHPPKNN